MSLPAICAAPAIARWARRPRVWWLTAIGNSGAMTLHRWHIPVLLGVHLVFDRLGGARYPGLPHFASISIAQLGIVAAGMTLVFVVLRPLENNPLPGWDGPIPAVPGRGVTAGLLLVLAGAATLVAVQWGLKDDGLICMAVMLTALAGARVSGHGLAHLVAQRFAAVVTRRRGSRETASGSARPACGASR